MSAKYILILFSALLIPIVMGAQQINPDSTETKKQESKVENAHHTVKVLLERIYLNGDISEEVVEETILSMEDFWASYEDWQLVDMNEEQVVFQKYIDDISPLLKTNGYFGITDEGILTIFDGKPDNKSDRVKIIQSFFQIDIQKLESQKHEELKKGIPIKTKDRYVEVIETFKHYSVNKEKK